MAHKVRNISKEDIEAMRILKERKGLICNPWCKGVQNYYLDNYPKDLVEIKKELAK